MTRNRYVTTAWLMTALVCAAFAPSLEAREAESPSEFFPAHTYLYLQINPFSGYEGFQALKLARLLEDPTLRGLFEQALAEIPPQSDPRNIIHMYRLDEVMGDSLAFGTVGFNAQTRGTPETPPESFRFPEDGALPPDLFNKIKSFDGENMIVIKVAQKELFMQTIQRILGDFVFGGEPPQPVKEQYEGIEVDVWAIPGLPPPGKLFTAFKDSYFLVAQEIDTLAAAINRQASKSASLDSRQDFSRFEKHRGDKPAAAFLHVGVRDLITLFSPLIPPADREEIGKWGGFDYSGLQVGLGFHEGGICEWFHLAFAENPRGVFMNLARLWPSWGLVEQETHRGTLYAASLNFDWAALYNVVMFILDLCEVDTASFTEDVTARIGMDLRDDLLGALGNRMGALMVLPRHGFIPEVSLAFSIRNREKMEKVLSRLEEIYKCCHIPVTRFAVPGGGPKGTYIDFGNEIPVKPAYAIYGDNLVISTMPLMLKYAMVKSRTTGKAIVDMLPEATAYDGEPMISFFVDPAPVVMDLYADTLKIMDSGSSGLPVRATDLPTPEFVAGAVSQIGMEFSIDPYFMSLDLHSPTGIGIPLVIGALAAREMEAPPSPPRP